MTWKNRALFTTAVLPLLISVPAMATIVSGTVTGGSAFTAGGTFVKLTPPLSNLFGAPDSVGNDNFQSPDLYGFDEDQNITITTALAVDVGTAPAVGTVVASHYIFFDPGPSQRVIGTVNFDSNVIAIITSTAKLNASDILANTGVHYLSPSDRGLEAGDSVTISGQRQILFDTTASSPGDYVRVLTEFSPAAAVPEPGALSMLGIGCAALAATIRKRRKNGQG
jgi:hypothetical protein